MKSCEEKGYHGTLIGKDGNPWVCKDCGADNMCSMCGVDKDEEYKGDLYDFIGERLCKACVEEHKPISDRLKSYAGNMSDRDFVRTILELEKERDELKGR